ncbi:MAG: ABC transporter ATP-binding protein [Chloroflexota bacterium]
MTILTIDHVTKRFTSREDSGRVTTAVDDVSLRIDSGEMLAIIGPSGCGKSTLLRLIAGLEKPDSGEVLYDREPLSEIPMEDRGIGMVFQEGALMPHWDAEHNISFFYRLRQREFEVPGRVQRISQITGIGLETLMARRPRQLSGGEKQRVAVARALTRDLRLLLFDEPFSNLDAKLRSHARIELKRLLREFPVTSVYVTHDQDEAATLGDRIAVMNGGQIEQIGSYRHLYESPLNLFVAKFFGRPAMNVFDGSVKDGVWHGENFGGYPIRSDLADGTPVTMGIRPQHMYLEEDGVPGVVDVIFPHLSERYQLVEVWLASERWSLALPMHIRLEVGQTIYCGLDAAQIHYFDTVRGNRIG